MWNFIAAILNLGRAFVLTSFKYAVHFLNVTGNGNFLIQNSKLYLQFEEDLVELQSSYPINLENYNEGFCTRIPFTTQILLSENQSITISLKRCAEIVQNVIELVFPYLQNRKTFCKTFIFNLSSRPVNHFGVTECVSKDIAIITLNYNKMHSESLLIHMKYLMHFWHS